MANAPARAAADAQRLEVRKHIKAGREAVFRAWTTSTSVRQWFSSPEAPVRKAKVEPRVGGRMHVECDHQGGTWTLDGVIRELDAPKRLAFTWASTDCPADVGSLVTVDFLEQDGGTEIVLVQQGFPTDAKRRENEAGWTELLDHVGPLIASQRTLRSVVRRTIAAPAEAVFRAWTTPALMQRFMSPDPDAGRVTADVRVGGKYEVVMVMDGKEYRHWGEYLEVDPPRRLAFSWLADWSPPDVNPRVTIDFIAHGDQTEVVLVHEGQLDEPTRLDHEEGWASILDVLIELAKAGAIAAGVAAAHVELRKAPRP